MTARRILLMNDYGGATGGAEGQMLALRDDLRDRGHQVRLLSSDASLVPGFEVEADRICHGRTDLAQVLTQSCNPSAWRAVRQEIRAFRPDLVHIRMFLFQLSPLVLQPLAGIPVLFQAAVYKAVCPTGLKMLPDGTPCDVQAGAVCVKNGCVSPRTHAAARLQAALLRRWQGRISRTLTLSTRMARVFRDSGWPGEVGVLGNGVAHREMRAPLGGRPTIGYAGRLSREKGVEVLLEAFAQVHAVCPAARLVLAGDGPLRADLEAMAARLPAGAVHFLGHLPRDEMERVFAPLWVQVVPSLWHEPFGNVTTEALMRGTAVVASDVGGQSDIITGSEHGLLVPPNDPGALAQALLPLVQDRDRAEAMGQAAHARAVAVFDRARVVDRLEHIYEEMIASGAP